MSKKYIITIKSEYEDTTRGIMVLGARDSNLFVDTVNLDDLEELNSDYINEHFGDLQDEAYRRGFEDGKWKSEDGCTGCQYEGKVVTGPPCITCCNSYINQWTAKKQDDEIKVGDEVDWSGDKFIVTALNIDDDDDMCVLMTRGGGFLRAYTDSLHKTGKHFDLVGMLKEMDE